MEVRNLSLAKGLTVGLLDHELVHTDHQRQPMKTNEDLKNEEVKNDASQIDYKPKL